MDSEKVIKRDGEYVLHTYNRNPIVLEKGHGLRAAGPEGQQYLESSVFCKAIRARARLILPCTLPLPAPTENCCLTWSAWSPST